MSRNFKMITSFFNDKSSPRVASFDANISMEIYYMTNNFLLQTFWVSFSDVIKQINNSMLLIISFFFLKYAQNAPFKVHVWKQMRGRPPRTPTYGKGFNPLPCPPPSVPPHFKFSGSAPEPCVCQLHVSQMNLHNLKCI